MMTSLLIIGAAIYGITRGIQNGTFQRLPQTVSKALNNPQGQQITQPLQNMAEKQNVQDLTDAVQGGLDDLDQQMGNNIQNNQL